MSSLENVKARPELERYDYHTLSSEELACKDDPEAIFERGIRLMEAIGVVEDIEAGWDNVMKAAQLGHPVALATCFHVGENTEENDERAIPLLRESAQRGHVAGKLSFCAITVKLSLHLPTATRTDTALSLIIKKILDYCTLPPKKITHLRKSN